MLPGGFADIDTKTPSGAHVYDYMLGGSDNYAVDRIAADQTEMMMPGTKALARNNRRYMERVVRYLARECGVRPFIDNGSGLPTRNNVHHIAQAIAPESRVVCIDNDCCTSGCAHVRAEGVRRTWSTAAPGSGGRCGGTSVWRVRPDQATVARAGLVQADLSPVRALHMLFRPKYKELKIVVAAVCVNVLVVVYELHKMRCHIASVHGGNSGDARGSEAGVIRQQERRHVSQADRSEHVMHLRVHNAGCPVDDAHSCRDKVRRESFKIRVFDPLAAVGIPVSGQQRRLAVVSDEIG
jgi:hypothetical protein